MLKQNDVDLEKCATASIKQHTGCQLSSTSETGRKCAIAVQHLDGRAVLIYSAIKEDRNGDLVLGSAKKHICSALTQGWHQRLVVKLFIRLVVGTAQIRQIIHCAPRSPSPSHEGPTTPSPRVYFQDFVLDPLLTEALHDSYIPIHSEAYPLNVNNLGSSSAETDMTLVHQSAGFSNDLGCPPEEKFEPLGRQRTGSRTNSTSTFIEHDDREIIVVRQIIDKTKVAWLLIWLLLLSPAVGTVVGICFHNAEVGIAVSAGVFALATFLQGLVAWIQG